MTFVRGLRLRALVLALSFAWLSAAIARADKTPADVVVVGGGPAGLAAALEARMAGAEHVIVLEKRSEQRTRANVLGIRAGTLDNLARLGVRLDDGTVGKLLSRRESIDDVAGTRASRRVRRPHPDPRRATHRVGDLLPADHGATALVPIADLETALLGAVRRTGGIELRFHVDVTSVTPAPDGVTATIRTDSGATESVRGAYLVLSDGARSTLREQLGVRTTRLPGMQTRIVGGVFEQPGDGTLTSLHVQGLRVVRLGGPKTGVLVEPAPDRAFTSPADLLAFYRQSAAKLGVTGELAVPPSLFDVSLQRADDVVVGERVFLIGDAARTTHVFTGLGVNWALRDATRFGRLFGRLRTARSPDQSRRALQWFRRETLTATTRLHRLAKPLFEDRAPTHRPPATPALRPAPRRTPAVRARGGAAHVPSL